VPSSFSPPASCSPPLCDIAQPRASSLPWYRHGTPAYFPCAECARAHTEMGFLRPTPTSLRPHLPVAHDRRPPVVSERDTEGYHRAGRPRLFPDSTLPRPEPRCARAPDAVLASVLVSGPVDPSPDDDRGNRRTRPDAAVLSCVRMAPARRAGTAPAATSPAPPCCYGTDERPDFLRPTPPTEARTSIRRGAERAAAPDLQWLRDFAMEASNRMPNYARWRAPCQGKK
jgi:hypothetical protein